MAQPDDFTTYSDIWASFESWSPRRQKALFQQIVDQLGQYGDQSVTNILDGMPQNLKKYVWDMWLAKCDLRKYSLSEMKKLVAESDSKNIGILWERWLSQKDLTDVSLVTFAKMIADLSPALQETCLKAFVAHCPNMAQYGTKEWETVRKILSSWATRTVSAGMASKPMFAKGDLVKHGLPYVSKVESVINSGGTWKYRLNDDSYKYYAESELTRA